MKKDCSARTRHFSACVYANTVGIVYFTLLLQTKLLWDRYSTSVVRRNLILDTFKQSRQVAKERSRLEKESVGLNIKEKKKKKRKRKEKKRKTDLEGKSRILAAGSSSRRLRVFFPERMQNMKNEKGSKDVLSCLASVISGKLLAEHQNEFAFLLFFTFVFLKKLFLLTCKTDLQEGGECKMLELRIYEERNCCSGDSVLGHGAGRWRFSFYRANSWRFYQPWHRYGLYQANK